MEIMAHSMEIQIYRNNSDEAPQYLEGTLTGNSKVKFQ